MVIDPNSIIAVYFNYKNRGTAILINIVTWL